MALSSKPKLCLHFLQVSSNVVLLAYKGCGLETVVLASRLYLGLETKVLVSRLWSWSRDCGLGLETMSWSRERPCLRLKMVSWSRDCVLVSRPCLGLQSVVMVSRPKNVVLVSVLNRCLGLRICLKVYCLSNSVVMFLVSQWSFTFGAAKSKLIE